MREMERDAVAITFPSWEWHDDDEVEIRPSYDPGRFYSSATFEPAQFEIWVGVRRKDPVPRPASAQSQKARGAWFCNEDAKNWFLQLMAKASEGA